MINHLSLRLAWHNDGWNGHICKDPKANVYCVGQHSYPGDRISQERNLAWESRSDIAGRHCSTLDAIPPCAYSINAFGDRTIKARNDPPDFYRDESEGVIFDVEPATACTWPYELMYNDEVTLPEGRGQTYDYDKRLRFAKQFFKELTPNKSLIFYYANKSNPFNEDDAQRYVLIGISRMRKTGEVMFYKNVSEKNRRKYAGGFVWQMPVSSHYPDQGFRIPYHKYLDDEEVLENLLVVPENSNNFKYAAKHISDDDALIYVERLLEVVGYLAKLRDNTENWEAQKKWLQSLLSELWKARGPYPGLPAIFDHLDFSDLIAFYKEQVERGEAHEAKEDIFKYLDDRKEQEIEGCAIPRYRLQSYRRDWLLKVGSPRHRELLRDVLSRIDVSRQQVANILAERPSENGIYASPVNIIENPYILAEQYVGDELGDQISFNKVDHGMLPAPNLELEQLAEKEDWRRLRALCVEKLRKETKHSFVATRLVLHDVNHKLSFFPEWKRAQFNLNYIDYYRDELDDALTFRQKGEESYVYLNDIFEDERKLEQEVRALISRPDIPLTKPFSKERWKSELYEVQSPLAQQAPEEYEEAIESQIKVCQRLFTKPVCVLSGAAGTGKTTLIKAIINAIKHTSSGRESFCLLAPTGKAADRIREKTNEEAFTIHQFVARKGWLNPNFTFKRIGGKREDSFTTYIIDESSMLDLSLMATLFRAINWNYVRRIILIGDPNQLPPIGRGKVFADVIDFLQKTDESNVGRLKINMRQMENRVLGRGTGILDLASLYLQVNLQAEDVKETQDQEVEGSEERSDVPRDTNDQVPVHKSRVETFLKEVQEEGDIREDLRILSWNDPDELERLVVQTIQQDMKEDGVQDPMEHQILSPYRGERFGTERLNEVVQKEINGRNSRKGTLGGVALFDKVIQYRNRAGKRAYHGYDLSTRQKKKVAVYNGEIGKAWYHFKDKNFWKRGNFYPSRLRVHFQRKPDIAIEFTGETSVSENLELAYAISVHKSQGSEFERVYLILPKKKQALLSTELLYTGITRARRHLTLYVEKDFTTLITLRRPEKSHLAFINSSIFSFEPLDDDLLTLRRWYEEGKIHSTLAGYMVRSKSEVIIVNMLHDRGIDFKYEEPLFAPDGTFYLPDFTVYWQGQVFFWEHVGRLDLEDYRNHWHTKKSWYEQHYPGQLLTTYEGPELSEEAHAVIAKHLSP